MKINVGDKIASVRHNWIGIITAIHDQDVYMMNVNGEEINIERYWVRRFLSEGKWKLILRNALIRMKERLG